MSVMGPIKKFLTAVLLAQVTASTAWGLSENLTEGEIFIASKIGNQGHAISFQRLAKSGANQEYWYLQTVVVKNSLGQVIGVADSATWDEAQGILYLEHPDRTIHLLQKN